ncbi:glycerol-3-phosphate dehydrogenase (NAD(P)+) [Pacificibacter maritimus]|uniref:Glycerol-3-phosphate dehydrogenase [NAD(P)+] n=1 Tax=Pacificibacter maritimus TaxID=762213 RepID=A0A3N4UCG5_9RHOB|nr:NAD(P)H-dependent glycerol-3-phosphate dehydrogenase [Pacificibacter maritimus]RPE64749.1 glycerol-3-phosphate dehydrogenase (NAD(P)+) [Pacificibacter maritimus]
MAGISVLGAGAFGTALAISLSTIREDVTLWGRSPHQMQKLSDARCNAGRLPDIALPNSLKLTHDLNVACQADIILIATPMQSLSDFAKTNVNLLAGKKLVSCCKGVDLVTNQGPVSLLQDSVPNARVAILSGPSFAIDIARGLPTALTIASVDEALVAEIQSELTTENIRLYSSLDPIGVEFGGALKNVMAIACGITIGAGLGESARAALITRGNIEMQRLAVAQGALPKTLLGLSGFGDLVLTCTSEKSRNFSHGVKLGRNEAIDPTITVEGVATARAVANLAHKTKIDMPITGVVTNILDGKITIKEAVEGLLSRPLKRE